MEAYNYGNLFLPQKKKKKKGYCDFLSQSSHIILRYKLAIS